VTAEGERVEVFDLSPDGRTVLYRRAIAGRERTELRLADFDTGTSELIAEDAWGMAWSPDSQTIAYSLGRYDRTPFEDALAIRRIGGPERLLSRWSAEWAFFPSGWTRDGRAILGSFRSPREGIPKLALWTLSDVPKDRPDRILIEDPETQFWQATFSPDSRWVSFVATSKAFGNRVRLFVAPASGGPAAEWRQIAEEHDGPDKPRWAPDGRTLFFLSRHRTTFYNLWGIRFDSQRGASSGAPFVITKFDSASFGIAPDLSNTELGVAGRRVVLPMRTVTGSIWMLEGVDR
jgi:Tol biopolymer transport system component